MTGALSPGSRIGPYAIVSALGAGGMGEVYRARDTKLNRDVAARRTLARLLAREEELRASRSSADRSRRRSA